MTKFNYASNRPTQVQQATELQVKNNAGGFVFKLPAMKQLERFLILGSDAPTYYQNAQELTLENTRVVQACWAEYPKETFDTLMAFRNRVLKQDPLIFALALGTLAADVQTRRLVYAGLHQIANNASKLFMFCDFLARLGKGWGMGLRKAVARFYETKDVDRLAYQVVKYRTRNGFDHSRLLNLTHPKPVNEANADVMNFIMGRETTQLPDIITKFREVQEFDRFHPELPWEAYPNDRIPWDRLAPTMGYTALVRNLNKFTLTPLSELSQLIVRRLETENPQMHPFNLYIARRTYQQGRGFRGSLTWTPNPQVVAALETAFLNSFKYVKPKNERILIGLDVSGSMSSPVGNGQCSAYEAEAAMALSILRSEKNVFCHGFSTTFVPLPFNSNTNLEEINRVLRSTRMGGGTDCATPMLYAMQNKIQVDKFVVFTDDETWYGVVHPFQALEDYRKRTGINAKLIVAGMTSTGFSIANPNDTGMLDIVGMDSNLPTLVTDF